jgi:hypothetical protein
VQTHLEASFRSAENVLDDLCRRSTGKEESEVAIAFGERDHRPSWRDGDLGTNDSLDGAGPLLAGHLVQSVAR